MKYRKIAAQTSRASVLSKAYIKKINTSPATALKDIAFTTLPKENAVSNSFGIQMIPKSLQSKLFCEPTQTLQEKVIKQCLMNLNKFKLNQGNQEAAPVIDISLPDCMANLPKFFDNVAKEQLHPYLEFIQQMVATKELPHLPSQWSRTPGWSKYTSQGPVSVGWPTCQMIVLDVEVCIRGGNKLPSLAVAMSPDFVYSWVSPALDKPWLYNRTLNTSLLIPLGNEAKVVVGHNVMYDRARVKEEYHEERSALRFLDTLSLHVCVSGLENTQKGKLLAAIQNNNLDKDWMKVGAANSLAAVHEFYCGTALDKSKRDVFVSGTHMDVQSQFQELVSYCASDVVATYNVLREVWQLFQERFPSPVTLSGMFEMASCYVPVSENWQRYMEEADATFYNSQGEIKQIMSNLADDMLLRYNRNRVGTESDIWASQLDWSTKKISGVKNKKLSIKANREMEALAKEPTKTVEISNIIKTLCDEKVATTRHYMGVPEWYRSICPKPSSFDDIGWSRGPHDISLSTKIAPILLKLSYLGYPLYRTPHHGWGYLVPKPKDDVVLDHKLINLIFPDTCIQDPVTFNGDETRLTGDIQKLYADRIENIENQIEFLSKKGNCPTMILQHDWKKISPSASAIGNVGNPLGKAFTRSIEENILCSQGGWEAEQVLTLGAGLTYWRNNRSRIISQFVVDLQDHDVSSDKLRLPKQQNRIGVILPEVVPAGTITRRAIEQTWLTTANIQSDRVGSELKGVVTAFPGYCFVGADVDSQELWIASLIGDSTIGDHGATPLGWMSLQGQKSDGTDMHSQTAKRLSEGRTGLVSRDVAKAFNYARIYGSGKGLARNMLRDNSKDLSEDEIWDRIDRMFDSTKGKQTYELTNFGKKQLIADGAHWNIETITQSDLQDFCTRSGYLRYTIAKIRNAKYVGGSESAMFNQLEEIARSAQPATPFLKSRITRTLEPKVIPKSYQLNSRINWVVQSSAVDFLHLLLVSMKWFMKEYSIPGRFVLSIHDEVRFHIPIEYKYEAALALQLSNLLTRAFFSTRLGIHNLPNNIAFFSGVDIDRSLRKNVNDECVTPSNPHGLSVTYGIEAGEELNIHQLLEKVNVLKVNEL